MNIIVARKVIERALEALLNFPGDISDQMFESIISLKAALAEPEQEPVAWVDVVVKEAREKYDLATSRAAFQAGAIFVQRLLNTSPEFICSTQLCNYRKPLTDEEIEFKWEEVTGHSIFGGDRKEGRGMFISPDEVTEFARAIEAAHSHQDDYELLGYVELGGYFGVEQARKNGLSGVPVAIYVEPLLPEPNNDLTQMVPIYIKPAKEKPTT